MTAEQHMLQLTATEAAPAAVELYNPRHVHERSADIGRLSLEGFTVMEAVDSPWEDVRTKLEARIVSQPAAIGAVVEALEGSTVRMPDDKRPVATLAFLGPTGVGKSETAKTLAEAIDGNKKLVKIDCSDYSHGHEVASLTGSPVGYVGYGQTPVLNKERIEGYGTVVLFDEIEKGSEELYNLMLQIMEDGELQLKNGQTTNFRDAIIILTSNLGAKEMAAQLSDTPLGFAGRNRQVSTDQLDEVATKSFKEFFRPEFINRLSKMVVFHPLDRDALGQVLDTKLAQTNEAYEQELGARVSISAGVRDYLVELAAAEPHLGARPLVRALDNHVYTTFGRYWGAGAIPEGTHVKVFHRSEVGDITTADSSSLVFTSKPDGSIRKRVPARNVLAVPFSDITSPPPEAVEREEDEPGPEEE